MGDETYWPNGLTVTVLGLEADPNRNQEGTLVMIRHILSLVAVVALVLAVGFSLATPALAAHGQDVDNDSVNCPASGWLAGSGYGHQWQVHVHDGQS